MLKIKLKAAVPDRFTLFHSIKNYICSRRFIRGNCYSVLHKPAPFNLRYIIGEINGINRVKLLRVKTVENKPVFAGLGFFAFIYNRRAFARVAAIKLHRVKSRQIGSAVGQRKIPSCHIFTYL